jgi:hypothetical protein
MSGEMAQRSHSCSGGAPRDSREGEGANRSRSSGEKARTTQDGPRSAPALAETLGSQVSNRGSSATTCMVPCKGRAALRAPSSFAGSSAAAVSLLPPFLLPAPTAACPPPHHMSGEMTQRSHSCIGGAPRDSREGEGANRSRSSGEKAALKPRDWHVAVTCYVASSSLR